MKNLGVQHMELLVPWGYIVTEKHPSPSTNPVINKGCNMLEGYETVSSENLWFKELPAIFSILYCGFNLSK